MAELSKSVAAQQLIQERAQQAALHQQELQRRTPQHPAVKQVAARVEELDRQLSAIAANVRHGIGQDFQLAVQNERQLQAKLQELKTAVLNEQDRALQHEVLKRKAEATRQLYDGLLKRLHEVRAGSSASSPILSVLDLAEIPEQPIRPRILLNILLAAATGIGLALFTTFAREAFQNKVRSR